MHFHCFIWFLTIFMIFLIFNKHEQTSWFQTMEFMESTHAKLIRALVRARHSWYLLQFCLLEMLIFYSSRWYTWICFVFIVENTLVSHRGVLACHPGTLSSHIFFLRTLWTCMLLMTISIFDVILECLDIWLICLNKTNVVWCISKLISYVLDRKSTRLNSSH